MTEDVRDFQAITAAVVVSGYQRPQISAHGDGGAGSQILVKIGNCMLHMQDYRGAVLYHRTWSNSDAPSFSLELPKYRPVPWRRLAPRPTLMVEVRGGSEYGDETKVWMDDQRRLLIRIGQLTWAMYDRHAHDSLALAFKMVRDVADDMLPRKYGY